VSMPNDRPAGLGRGLAALIPQRSSGATGSVEIPLARIRENPRQPRLRMNDEALASLAESIRQHGVIQPILVTETIDGYQLVAGERRFRASKLAGLDRIPAIVRQLADREQLEVALVENLQREDLGPMEEAHAFRALIDEFALSQDDIAVRVGRARSTVANTLRLLDLDERVQAAIADGSVSEGHVAAAPDTARRHADPDLERVEDELRRSLGTKVTLARSRRGGRIIIEYYSDEELGQLYDRLIGGPA
jgi:ParB family chromosome partitioning protein